MTRATRHGLLFATVVLAVCCFSTAYSQNLQIYDSSGKTALDSITFTVPPGGRAPDQVFLLKSTSGQEQPLSRVFLNMTADLQSFWTADVRPERMTPTPVTISQSFNAPNASAIIEGSLDISTFTAVYRVPVHIKIGIDENQPLTVDRPSPVFHVKPGDSSELTLSVGSSSGTAKTFKAAVTSSSTSWLSVIPAGVSVNTGTSNLTVKVTSTGLQEGTYTGVVTLTPTGNGKTTTINVTMNVSSSGSGTGPLTVSPTSLVFSVPGDSFSQSIDVQASETTDFSISVGTVLLGAGWLSASVSGGSTTATGSTPATIAVTVNPIGVGPGTYTSEVILKTSGGSTQSIPVTLAVGRAPDSVTATPSSIAFLPISKDPVSQQIQISTDPAGVFYTASVTLHSGADASWLKLSDDTDGGLTGTTPTAINVTADFSSLPVGEYSADVTLTFLGPINSTVTIPISLKTPGATSLSLDTSTLVFSGFAASGQNPAPQRVVLSTGDGAADFKTSITLPSCGGSTNWLSITPATGTTTGSPAMAAVTIAPDLNGVALGSRNLTCTGLVTFSIPGVQSRVLTVHLQLRPVPTPQITAVQNGVSFIAGAISAGEMIAIKGSDLGPAQAVVFSKDQATTAVPTTLGTTQVLIDNMAIPITYASATEVRAFVPYEIDGKATVALQVKVPGALSSTVVLPVAPTAPGLFTVSGTSQVQMLNEDGSSNGPACAASPCSTAPAAPGSVVTVYGTGEGVATPRPVTGSITSSTPPFAQLVNGPVTVKVGGVPIAAEDVLYAGPAPGMVAGIFQVNFRIPEFVNASEPVPLSVVIGNNESQPVTFIVR